MIKISLKQERIILNHLLTQGIQLTPLGEMAIVLNCVWCEIQATPNKDVLGIYFRLFQTIQKEKHFPPSCDQWDVCHVCVRMLLQMSLYVYVHLYSVWVGTKDWIYNQGCTDIRLADIGHLN